MKLCQGGKTYVHLSVLGCLHVGRCQQHGDGCGCGCTDQPGGRERAGTGGCPQCGRPARAHQVGRSHRSCCHRQRDHSYIYMEHLPFIVLPTLFSPLVILTRTGMGEKAAAYQTHCYGFNVSVLQVDVVITNDLPTM